MKFAVVENNFVTNVIVAQETQKDELEAAYNAELVDALPCNLQIGDRRANGNWTRNVEGEEVTLGVRPTYHELEDLLQETEIAATDTEIALMEAELELTEYEIAEMEV